MATWSQPHGTRWLEFGGIQMIKAVCNSGDCDERDRAERSLPKCPNRGNMGATYTSYILHHLKKRHLLVTQNNS